jgi:hypothetical protein
LAAIAVTAAGATAHHGTATGLSASADRPGWRHVTTYRWDKELRQLGGGWDHGRRSWWRFALDPAGKYLWILDSNEQWLMRLSIGGGSPPVTNQSVPSGDGREKWDLEAISCDETGLLWVCQVNRGDRWRFEHDTDPQAEVRHRLLAFNQDGQFLGDERRFVVPDKRTTVVGDFAVTRRGTLFVNSVDPIDFGVVASFSCLDASGNGLWSVGGALEDNVYPTVWLMGEQAYLEYDGTVRAVSESNPLVPRKSSARFEATYHGFVGFDPAGDQVCVTQASLRIYSPKGALLSSYPFPKNAPPEDVWLRWESARNVFLSRTGTAFLVDASSRKGMYVWDLVRSGNGQGH